MITIIVQWATILSPIIAVVIAIWASRSSAKDTARQIAALEESTTKQIDSIKELALLQLEISLKQIDKDLWETRYRLIQNNQKSFDELDDEEKAFQAGINKDVYHKIVSKQRESSYIRDLYSKQIDLLNNLQSQLKAMKTKIGGGNNG